MVVNVHFLIQIEWSENNGLKLNPDKTQAMVISASKNPSLQLLRSVLAILVQGISITFAESVKDLGLIMDRNLSWKNHVFDISCRTYIVLQQLYRNKVSFPISTRILLIKALILSMFDYCCTTYDNITDDLNDKLE